MIALGSKLLVMKLTFSGKAFNYCKIITFDNLKKRPNILSTILCTNNPMDNLLAYCSFLGTDYLQHPAGQGLILLYIVKNKYRYRYY